MNTWHKHYSVFFSCSWFTWIWIKFCIYVFVFFCVWIWILLCNFLMVFLNVCIFWSSSWLYSGAGLLRHQYLMPGRGDKTSRRPLSQILDEHHLHHQSCQYHHQHHCHDQHFQFSILQNGQEHVGEVVVGDIIEIKQNFIRTFRFFLLIISLEFSIS